MNQTRLTALYESSRLAVCLQLLGLSDNRQVQHDMVERLADLIDLSDAFTLSEQLRGLSRMPFSASPAQNNQALASSIKAHFIQERTAIMQLLIKKSTPGPDNRLLGLDMPDNFDMLLRFYTLQQSEMEHQILKLRSTLRESIKGISRKMQQLVALDIALADTVAMETRKALSHLPRLLKKQFIKRQQEPESYLQFIHDMQSLLLAELDTRLQPLTGLVEALDEEVGI